MNRSYKWRSSSKVGFVCLVAVCGACSSAAAGGEVKVIHDIELPAETAALRPSALPGYTIALQKCGICHSADYINLQPPRMSLAQWTAEMTKMQHAYGAPIDEAEIKLLGNYLTATYGDAASITPTEAALTTPAAPVPSVVPPQAESTRVDVHMILDHNACLSCHALQQKIVGPSYHDVAEKYKDDAEARSKLQANIRAGGSGKWGAVPMPPFPHLSGIELQLLADFVLQQ